MPQTKTIQELYETEEEVVVLNYYNKIIADNKKLIKNGSKEIIDEIIRAKERLERTGGE